jgi:hypothetical protein
MDDAEIDKQIEQENSWNKQFAKFNEIHKETIQRCGQVIRLGAGVEENLNFFLTFAKQNITRMTFDQKIKLFVKICESKKIDPKRIEEIRKALDFVRETRNTAAHDKLYSTYPDESVMKILYQNKSGLKEINEDTIKKLGKMSGVIALNLAYIRGQIA